MSAERNPEQIDVRAQFTKHPDAREASSEAISTVWALIACMLRIASRPMPDIAISMNAITAMTLARIESADMADSLKCWRLAPLTN